MSAKEKETVRNPYPGHLDFNFRVTAIQDLELGLERFRKEINGILNKQKREIASRPPLQALSGSKRRKSVVV